VKSERLIQKESQKTEKGKVKGGFVMRAIFVMVALTLLVGLASVGCSGGKQTSSEAGLDQIETKLDSLSTVINEIKDDVVTIETDAGTVKASLSAIDAKVIGVDENIVTIQTNVGTIMEGIASSQGTIAQSPNFIIRYQPATSNWLTVVNVDGRGGYLYSLRSYIYRTSWGAEGPPRVRITVDGQPSELELSYFAVDPAFPSVCWYDDEFQMGNL
jgi:hypothetical protein